MFASQRFFQNIIYRFLKKGGLPELHVAPKYEGLREQIHLSIQKVYIHFAIIHGPAEFAII